MRVAFFIADAKIRPEGMLIKKLGSDPILLAINLTELAERAF